MIMKKEAACHGGVCAKCHGAKLLVFGLILIGWATWWAGVDWRIFLGWVAVIAGALKIIKPTCGHCN